MKSAAEKKARYKKCFDQLKKNSQGAFVPFVMLADPDLDLSCQIITTLINNGADALELGLPFSDPIADGPVIQAAAIRALSNGSTTSKCFELIRAIRNDYPEIPIGLLVYSNLVVSNSIENFYSQASAAGVDSVLIADVPTLESQPFIAAAKIHSIDQIFIATPNADENKLKQVAEIGLGYTYLLSRAGVTGTEVKAEMPINNVIETLKQHNAPPSLIGFGISSPQQVKRAIEAGADGAISGSAVVKIIQENLDDGSTLLNELANFVIKMKKATFKTV